MKAKIFNNGTKLCDQFSEVRDFWNIRAWPWKSGALPGHPGNGGTSRHPVTRNAQILSGTLWQWLLLFITRSSIHCLFFLDWPEVQVKWRLCCLYPIPLLHCATVIIKLDPSPPPNWEDKIYKQRITGAFNVKIKISHLVFSKNTSQWN